MHPQGLQLALVLLLAAVVAVPLFKRVRLGAVLGYLVAGAVLGPHGFGAIRANASVLSASEIGVVLLLFVIGLELSPARLAVMRRQVVLVGGAQVLSGGVLLAALAAWALALPWATALVVGLGLALSSTAVGLQLLAERNELASAHGRSAFAVLLFQDLAAIPLLAVIPMMAAGDAAMSWPAVLRAVAVLAMLLVGGRWVLRALFRAAARADMPEVLTAAALLAVLGSAWLMQLAGLSPGLGAFIAGVLLADSEFRHEIESQVEPFKGLALGVFFITVGMRVDPAVALQQPWLVFGGVLLLLALKGTLLAGIGRALARLSWRESVLLATVLAMGGEFAFVVFADAARHGLLEPRLEGALVAMVGLSMALTPLLLLAVQGWHARHVSPQAPRAFDDIDDRSPTVLIAGFGRVGQIVARLLLAARVRFVAIEHNAEQVDFIRRFGIEVFYGDPARPDLLRAAGAASVKVFVVAIDDVAASVRTVRVVRRLYPAARVVARARDRRHAWQLMDLGAVAVRETFHSSLSLGGQVLAALGLPEATARDWVQRFRQHDERLLREQHLIQDDEAALTQSARDARRELEQLFDADLSAGAMDAAVGDAPDDAPRVAE
jgi:glutathione-regulated potassium-efflux system protein KefB